MKIYALFFILLSAYILNIYRLSCHFTKETSSSLRRSLSHHHGFFSHASSSSTSHNLSLSVTYTIHPPTHHFNLTILSPHCCNKTNQTSILTHTSLSLALIPPHLQVAHTPSSSYHTLLLWTILGGHRVTSLGIRRGVLLLSSPPSPHHSLALFPMLLKV